MDAKQTFYAPPDAAMPPASASYAYPLSDPFPSSLASSAPVTDATDAALLPRLSSMDLMDVLGVGPDGLLDFIVS